MLRTGMPWIQGHQDNPDWMVFKTHLLNSFVSADANNARRIDLQHNTRQQGESLLSYNRCFCELAEDAYPGGRNAEQAELLVRLRFEVLTRARNHAALQQEKNKLKQQEHSRLLPTDKRQVKIHDCITIDQPEPVSFSHLRDHGFRVISILGKVIGYVPITADRNQRPRHVHIDRVQVVPEVNWQEVNPRPRRNRRGPDVRTTQLIEHAADTGTSNINNTDNFEPPPTNDPGLNEQAPENT
ncbi:hypothetical protein CAPTEDRAFT_211116 [Capitella teleta]|uniref:Retrotransposon gag domain-containing protein n=1 Tax=Capitella teleta TaxID=283909 RepID=R7TN05_CAPTE|nr:hypothetical protein CAPTEDRAFT_211116 [Capitella teleta]|eukprot:ELT95248.1 hypothetical protein CAPTEDRAFT_211116 [Capitella teleta]